MCPRVHAPQQEKSMLQLEKATHTATGARAPQLEPEHLNKDQKKPKEKKRKKPAWEETNQWKA